VCDNYYNDNIKLWVCVDEKQYEKFLYDFLLNAIKKVRKLIRKEQFKDEITEVDVPSDVLLYSTSFYYNILYVL